MSKVQVEERYYNAFGKMPQLSREKSKTGHTFAFKEEQQKPQMSHQTIISPKTEKAEKTERGILAMHKNKDKDRNKGREF
jgi:hypothetical protein